MEYKGALIFDSEALGVYKFYYVTMSAEVFEANFVSWLWDRFRGLFIQLQRYGNALTDALYGVVNGMSNGVPADQILAHIPTTISAGTGFTTLSWLHGGNTEFFDLPYDVELAYVAADNVRCQGFVIPSLVSLSVLAVEGVSVYYKRVLTHADAIAEINPVLTQAIDVYNNQYVAYIPQPGALHFDAYSKRTWAQYRTIDRYPMSSFMSLAIGGILARTNPPIGNYFHVDSVLQATGNAESAAFSCFSFSPAENYYVPYDSGYPLDSTLQSMGLVREPGESFSTIVDNINYFVIDFLVWGSTSYPPFMVKPKGSLFPIVTGGGVVSLPIALGIVLLQAARVYGGKNG